MNTIEIHLCAEDRKRLDRLGNALEALTKPEKANKAGQPAPVVEDHPALDDLPFDTAPAAPAPKPVALDDVRAMAQMLLAPSSGKREACKIIITKYASKISLIPADKLPAVAAELEALQKGA